MSAFSDCDKGLLEGKSISDDFQIKIIDEENIQLIDKWNNEENVRLSLNINEIKNLHKYFEGAKININGHIFFYDHDRSSDLKNLKFFSNYFAINPDNRRKYHRLYNTDVNCRVFYIEHSTRNFVQVKFINSQIFCDTYLLTNSMIDLKCKESIISPKYIACWNNTYSQHCLYEECEEIYKDDYNPLWFLKLDHINSDRLELIIIPDTQIPLAGRNVHALIRKGTELEEDLDKDYIKIRETKDWIFMNLVYFDKWKSKIHFGYSNYERV